MPPTDSSISVRVLTIVVGGANLVLLSIIVLLLVFSRAEERQRLANLEAQPGQAFPQARTLRAEQQALLSRYRIVQAEHDSTYVIPIEVAMDLVVAESTSNVDIEASVAGN